VRVKPTLLFLITASRIALAGDGCIAGAVLDHGGSPISQMHVRIHNSEPLLNRTIDTDADGGFRFVELPPGNYDLVTENNDLGYPDSNNFDFTDNMKRLNVAVTASAECAPVNVRREARAGKLRLRLMDNSDGKDIPHPDANFRQTDGRHGWNAVSVHGNTLLVPSLKPVEVQVGAIGYESSEILKIARMSPGEERTLAISLRPVGLGCLIGTVVGETRKPVAGITVNPLLMENFIDAKTSLSTLTDKEGRFEMKDLHPGKYLVSVNDREKGYDSFSVMKRYGHFPEVNVLPSAACAEITIDLTPEARVLVDVVDASTQQLIPKFKFTVMSTIREQWWYTESMARESLVPPDKPCAIEAKAEGYKTSTPLELGTLQPREVRRLRIELQPDRGAATTAPSTASDPEHR
jgi:hypothetical protein